MEAVKTFKERRLAILHNLGQRTPISDPLQNRQRKSDAHDCCNFQNLHQYSLNQRPIFPKRPNNQNSEEVLKKKFRPNLSMRAIYSHLHNKNMLVKCTVSNFTRLIRSFSIIDINHFLLAIFNFYNLGRNLLIT